jgi:hypothetical protein
MIFFSVVFRPGKGLNMSGNFWSIEHLLCCLWLAHRSEFVTEARYNLHHCGKDRLDLNSIYCFIPLIYQQPVDHFHWRSMAKRQALINSVSLTNYPQGVF